MSFFEEMRTNGTEAIIQIRTEENFPEMKTILQNIDQKGLLCSRQKLMKTDPNKT